MSETLKITRTEITSDANFFKEEEKKKIKKRESHEVSVSIYLL